MNEYEILASYLCICLFIFMLRDQVSFWLPYEDESWIVTDVFTQIIC